MVFTVLSDERPVPPSPDGEDQGSENSEQCPKSRQWKLQASSMSPRKAEYHPCGLLLYKVIVRKRIKRIYECSTLLESFPLQKLMSQE